MLTASYLTASYLTRKTIPIPVEVLKVRIKGIIQPGKKLKYKTRGGLVKIFFFINLKE